MSGLEAAPEAEGEAADAGGEEAAE
jgi:hypothetical protein